MGMSGLTISAGTVINPETGTAAAGEISCDGDVIIEKASRGSETIDAGAYHAAPGIIDFGCFSADPASCIAGGITRAILMPDQTPVIDEPAMVKHVAVAGKPDLWIHPLAAATCALAGQELAELGLMKAAGAVAVATGRHRVADSGVMLKLLRYAGALDMVVVTDAMDEGLTRHAVATDGETATRLGLTSAPAVAEAMAIARDLLLAEESGAPIHFRQVTTARGFDLIRDAKQRGVKVSCGITPAHFLLCDVDIGPYRTFAKLSPPLRSNEDREAALAALADGTVDVICSGHDPLGPEAKRLPYETAEPGMSSAETLLALSLTLVRDGVCDIAQLFTMLSLNPARILGLEAGSLAPGAAADIVLFDPEKAWRIDSENMAATAGNTPFDGLPVMGRVIQTIKGGRPIDQPPS
jgi:dihydroorotase